MWCGDGYSDETRRKPLRRHDEKTELEPLVAVVVRILTIYEHSNRPKARTARNELT